MVNGQAIAISAHPNPSAGTPTNVAKEEDEKGSTRARRRRQRRTIRCVSEINLV